MLKGTVLALCALACLAPAAAHAADEVITFDDQPLGTTITDQYKARGLQLARDKDGPSGNGVTVTAAGANHVGVLDDSCGGEFCNFGAHLLDGRLDFARQKLRVTVTNAAIDGRPNDCDDPPILTALTSTGTVIGTDTKPRSTPVPFSLEVDSPSQNIAFFEVCGVTSIDDITYDNPSTPPPADFSVAPQYNQLSGADTVNVVTGDTVSLPVLVNRFNQSSGNLQVSLSGLPSGVTVAGFPKAVNTPDGATFALPIAAAKNAPPASADVTVTVSPQTSFAGAQPRTFKFTLNVLAQSDLEVSGIEVTQGIQTQFQSCNSVGTCATAASLPFRDLAHPTSAINYSGVQLVSHRQTFARVFANRRFPASGSPTTGATITLHGFRNGKELPGSPLTRPAPPLFPGGNVTTLPERTDISKAALFVLPDSWTSGPGLDLQARVEPALAFIGTEGATDCTTSECLANNALRMNGIGFVNTGYVDLATAKLWVPGENLSGVNIPCCFASQKGLEKFYPDPVDVFKYPEAVLPLADGALRYDHFTYYASINAGDVLNSDSDDRTDDALALLDDYSDDYPGCSSRNFCADQIIGVYGNEITTAGVSHGDVADSDHSGVANYRRPDSATHEMSHGYGRAHASKGCGGDSGGQSGEDWPPDASGQHGYMDGIGYDRRTGAVYAQRSLGAFGSAANPTGPGDPLSFSFQPSLWFDYMSYCRVKEGNDAGIWTSVRGWNENMAGLIHDAQELGRARVLRARSVPAPLVPGQARAAAADQLLRIRITAQLNDEASFDSIKPRAGTARVGAPGSPYIAEVRDVNNKVLSTTPMIAEPKHIEGAAAAELALMADVPATNAHAVNVLHNGVLIASELASDNAPKVRVVAPRKGARVGTGRTVGLRWTATDQDGDHLRVTVDYSTDGGATFVPIYLGPNDGSTTIPAYLFAGSRRARIRVRANDGFHETGALSAIFTAVGRKPTVQISSPVAKQRVRADETLVLTGQALDDRHRPITARRRLTWFEGSRRLGRGASIAVTGLRAGTRRIRLVAKDATGRRGSATVPVKVVAVTPKLLAATPPSTVAASAASFKLRVAATVPAKLKIGSQTFKVGRKAKNVTVKITPGSGVLSLTLQLSAGGHTSTALLTVARS